MASVEKDVNMQLDKVESAIDTRLEHVANNVNNLVDEVEIKVEEARDVVGSVAVPLVENVRRLLLAGIGAVALSFDEAEGFVKKLVDRGEIAQKDGEKLINEVRERVSKTTNRVQDQATKVVGEPVERVEQRVESGLESLLARLNIPSKRDIDELSAKIAQLSARVDDLRKAQNRLAKAEKAAEKN